MTTKGKSKRYAKKTVKTVTPAETTGETKSFETSVNPAETTSTDKKVEQDSTKDTDFAVTENQTTE